MHYTNISVFFLLKQHSREIKIVHIELNYQNGSSFKLIELMLPSVENNTDIFYMDLKHIWYDIGILGYFIFTNSIALERPER